MAVFHYVAHLLRDEPIFDTPINDQMNDGAAGMGAIYNDFDFNPMSLLHDEEIEHFSFSQQLTNSRVTDNDVASAGNAAALVQALDHAIIKADEHEGINYEDLVWDTELFDNSSETCDLAYMEKVVTLASNTNGSWESLGLTEKAVNMFRRRLRTKWEGADTVYDAWLIRKGCERPWFDYHLLDTTYPDFDPNAEQEPPTQITSVSRDVSEPASQVIPKSPHEEIPSYQQPKPSSPDTSGKSQSEPGSPVIPKSPQEEIPSYQPPKPSSPDTSEKSQSEPGSPVIPKSPQEEIPSYQPPKPSKLKSNTDDSSSDISCNLQPDKFEKSPPPKPKITRRLSLKRCCKKTGAEENVDQSPVELLTSESENSKRSRQDSKSSVEFDISRAIEPGTSVIDISSNSSTSDDNF